MEQLPNWFDDVDDVLGLNFPVFCFEFLLAFDTC